MLGRKRGGAAVAERAASVRRAVSNAAVAAGEYVDPLAKDEKLRRRLLAAAAAGAAARGRVRRQTGAVALVRRLASDPVLRAQLFEAGRQLQAAQKQAKKARLHKARNTILFVGGVAMVVAAVPAAREGVMSLVRRAGGEEAEAPAPVENVDRAAPETV